MADSVSLRTLWLQCRRALVCALWFGLVPLQSHTYAQGERAAYQVAAERRLEGIVGPEMPGFAYAIVEQGEVIEVGAMGVKRLGGDEPVDPETPFLIGSISKSFTAIGVMQLVEAGQLSLEEPVSSHLPAFAGGPSGTITIDQLLSHTSGYSTYQGHTALIEDSTGGDPIARQADKLAATAPAYEPGTRWEYSNANYQILGRLIEVVSGQAYPAYIQAKILEPAGMVHSFVSDGERHAEMATGHRPWFGSRRPLPDNRTHLGGAPQGGIVASARDLTRYMLLMMNREDDILRAETKATMMNPANEASPFYGLGWFLDRENGTVWHSGASPGVETLLTMMPAEGKGVVVLINAGSGVGFGETAPLSLGITTGALGLDPHGKESRLWQKATFVALVLLPIVFLCSMVWAWRHRSVIRARSGPAGVFSLWFPLLTTLAAAWVLTSLVPQLFGVPLGTLYRFQPDLGLAMMGAAVTGVLWSVFRLGVAYTGTRGDRLRSPAGHAAGAPE